MCSILLHSYQVDKNALGLDLVIVVRSLKCRVRAACVLQRLFGHLQCSDRSSFFPGDFIEKYTHSNGQMVDIRQHHDALEFFQRTQVSMT